MNLNYSRTKLGSRQSAMNRKMSGKPYKVESLSWLRPYAVENLSQLWTLPLGCNVDRLIVPRFWRLHFSTTQGGIAAWHMA